MNSNDDRIPTIAPPNRAVFRRLLFAWFGVLAAAMFYCALHDFEFGNFVFHPWVTLKWAITRWGAWPVLLPACYWLIYIAQSRAWFGKGIAVAAVAAVVGTAVFAYFIELAFGGTWTFFEAAYHMAPIGAGTFALFVAIGFWLLYSSGAGVAAEETPVGDNGPVCLVVWKGQVQTSIDARQVEWVRAARNYVEFFDGGNSYIMRTSMAELERLLPADLFLRAHRSYLVNTRLIAGLEGGRSRPSLVLESGSKLPVGKTYRNKVFATFGSRSIAA